MRFEIDCQLSPADAAVMGCTHVPLPEFYQTRKAAEARAALGHVMGALSVREVK